MNKTVLIVEDEATISDIIKFNLEKEGYEVLTAFDGPGGLEKALRPEVSLVLLDIMLPGLDGWEVCKRIREKSDIPVLMLTARDEEIDKVLGLELGADDYITKPFSMRELVARVKAHLRRAQPREESQGESDRILSAGDLKIDLDRLQVYRGETPVDLSNREFSLLKFFVSNPDKVFSREQIMETVWEYDGFLGDLRAVDVTVRRLREKIEPDPSSPIYIQTKRGVGYSFSIAK